MKPQEWGETASPRIGEIAKVIFLSPSGDDSTIVLPHDIENDLASESGRTIAFTQGQRYVPLERMQKGPKTTSELLGGLGWRTDGSESSNRQI